MATKKKQKSNKLPCRMITPYFRVSYPHVFKAQAMSGSKPKYSITMLFPKNSDLMGQTLPDENGVFQKISIKDIMRNAKVSEFGTKENWPDDLESPVTDGDHPDNADKEGYKGHWAIKASSSEDQKPGVVDANGEPITISGELYPGCYARAFVYARVWKHDDTNRVGVQLILDHVQKVKDGKSFGGKKPVEQVFGAINAGDDDSESEDNEDFDFA